MGIKLIRREWKSGSVECRNEYICDTDADLVNLPEAPVGSTALSIESGSVRIVNTSGEWVAFAE